MTVVSGAGGALRLRDDEGEARVEVRVGASWMDLGGDAWHVVQGRLAAALRDPPPPGPTTVDGVATAWVLSLSSPHGSIHVGRTPAGVVLFLHHGDGDLIARIDLDADDVDRALAELGRGRPS